MKARRLWSFKADFDKLPTEIQALARGKFKLFLENPNHPSLRVKKMQGRDGIWEGHINIQYVFTFSWDSDSDTGEQKAVFRRIGTHQIYDKT